MKFKNSVLATLARTSVLAFSSVFLASAFVAPASALTLEELQEKNKLVVGVLAESVPWGFVNDQDQIVGYDPDVARLIAGELGIDEVEIVSVPVPSRIPELLSGKIDIAVAIMIMLPERAEVIQFSKPYGAQQIAVMGRTDLEVNDISDLEGLRVGVTMGSAQDTALTENAPEGTEILRFNGDAAQIQALITGHVDVIGGANTYMLNIEQAAPGRFEQKFVISSLYMGVGLRQEDQELHAAVNDAIDSLIASGALDEVSQRWLGQDLPEMPTEVEGVPFN